MARIVHDSEEIIDFVPEDDRGDKDPLTIKMKFVPYGVVKKYSEIISRRSKGIRNVTKLNEIQSEVQKQQFTDNVVGVENFFVIKGGKKTPVTDAGEFYEKADADLIYELIKAMEDDSKLTEGQRENFLPPSDGLSK
jgi:hypothetical protein